MTLPGGTAGRIAGGILTGGLTEVGRAAVGILTPPTPKSQVSGAAAASSREAAASREREAALQEQRSKRAGRRSALTQVASRLGGPVTKSLLGA